MGIFTERFAEEQTLLEIFMCPICHDVVEDPVVPNCPCQELYCRSCINGWLENHNSCPHCGSGQISSIKTLSPILRTAYISLKMKCETPECEDVLTVENHSTHASVCPKIPWACEESCGIVANMSFKAGHKCIEWLKSERDKLTTDLKDMNVKYKEIDAELKEEVKVRKKMEDIIIQKTSLIESIKKDHEKEAEKLRLEMLAVRKQLVEVNKERDQLHEQLDQLKCERGERIGGKKSIQISSSPTDRTSDNRGNRVSLNEDIVGRDGLQSTLADAMRFLNTHQDNSYGRKQWNRDGARERKSSVESTRSDISSRRPPPRSYRKTPQEQSNSSYQERRKKEIGIGDKKVVDFKNITKANEDIKSKVTSAVNEAHSKGLKGLSFCKEVARIMGGLLPRNDRIKDNWCCYSSDLYEPSRARMKRETLCAFVFDSIDFYVYERLWSPGANSNK